MGLSALAISFAFAVEVPRERAVPALAAARVPRALVERLEADYRRQNKRPADEPVKQELLAVALDLSSEREGVIDDGGRWRFAPGGGTFDFNPVVGTKPGRFNVKLDVRTAAGELIQPARVYFVPRGRSREIDGDRFGDGCANVLDLTRAYRGRFAAGGFDVFTTAQRYVSTLAGTFVIAAFDQKTLQVGHVTFTDSRWPGLLCQ